MSAPELTPTMDLAVLMKTLPLRLQGDFCFTRTFDALFTARLIREGFLVMAMNSSVLLPKLHEQRCILDLDQLHIPKKIRSLSRSFQLSVDLDFDGVIKGCRQQHGRDCWLYGPLVELLRSIQASNGAHGVRVHTIEIWKDGKLVGGEIGTAVGACYTSYSGFRRSASAGTVQCVALGKLLQSRGYSMWDLGMGLPYKYTFGAVNTPRLLFLAKFRKLRDVQALALSQPRFDCILLFPPSGEEALLSSSQAPETAPASSASVSVATETSIKSSAKPPTPRNPNSKRQIKYRLKMERRREHKTREKAEKAAKVAALEEQAKQQSLHVCETSIGEDRLGGAADQMST